MPSSSERFTRVEPHRDSTLAILGSITGNFDERVKELIGRIERPPGSRQGWRIPLRPQMAANRSQRIGKGGCGFGIPGSLSGWEMSWMQRVCHEDNQTEQP